MEHIIVDILPKTAEDCPYIMDGAISMNRWTYKYLLRCTNAVYGKTGELPIYVGRRI